MKHKTPFILIVCVALGVAVPATHEPATTDTAAADATSGLRVQFDPSTGRIVTDGTQPAAVADADPLFSTSADDLAIVPSPVEGGGMMINLQGRFMNAHVTTVDANGTRNVECVEQIPTPASSEEE